MKPNERKPKTYLVTLRTPGTRAFVARYVPRLTLRLLYNSESVVHLPTGKCIKNRFGKVWPEGYVKRLRRFS